MKLNQSTQIVGSRVVLIPYRQRHVETYHRWMGSSELRRLTGSEALSLQAEYGMQKSWAADDDKLTFIILSKEEMEKSRSELDSMAGDVNLFMNNSNRDGSDELEVMVADERFRRKGLALQAVSLMMLYANTALNIDRFFVKVTADNVGSMTLFQDKLGFEFLRFSEVFQENTLQLLLVADKIGQLKLIAEEFEITGYADD